jgi:putative ABC transport system permease protein
MDLYGSNLQFFAGDTYLVVRTRTDPRKAISAVTAAIWRVDPEQAVFDVLPMNERVLNTVWQQRLSSTLFIAFSVLALILASVGIYSVLSYAVTQRTREIGIRMALGAQRRDVLHMVLYEAIKMVLVGVVIGIIVSIIMARIMSSLLYKVSPYDLTIFLGVPVLLTLVALMACFAPAFRATRVDPMVALRYE